MNDENLPGDPLERLALLRPGERLTEMIAREMGLDMAEEAAKGFLYFSNVLLHDSLEDRDQDEEFMLERARRTASLCLALLQKRAPVAVHPVPAEGSATVMLSGMSPRLLCPCHLLPYGCHVAVEVSPRHMTLDWSDLAALVHHAFAGVRKPQDAAQALADIIDEAISPTGVVVDYSGEMWCADEDTLAGLPRMMSGKAMRGQMQRVTFGG